MNGDMADALAYGMRPKRFAPFSPANFIDIKLSVKIDYDPKTEDCAACRHFDEMRNQKPCCLCYPGSMVVDMKTNKPVKYKEHPWFSPVASRQIHLQNGLKRLRGQITMQQDGIINVEEFKKMAMEHAKENNPIYVREEHIDNPRREFRNNLRKLKDRNEKMDSKSKLPWKGFKI